MSIKYYYANNEYSSEGEAQNAAKTFSVCMENNPTNWMKVKIITGSNENGWKMEQKFNFLYEYNTKFQDRAHSEQ